MKVIGIDCMLAALRNEKRGTLREPFPGEEPDFVQERDKLCTGIMLVDSHGGFAASFDPPLQLVAGEGYVFEEAAE